MDISTVLIIYNGRAEQQREVSRGRPRFVLTDVNNYLANKLARVNSQWNQIGTRQMFMGGPELGLALHVFIT